MFQGSKRKQACGKLAELNGDASQQIAQAGRREYLRNSQQFAAAAA